MKDRTMSDQAEAAPTSTEPSIPSETCPDTVTAATNSITATTTAVTTVLTNDLKELKDTGSSSCSTSSSTTPTPVTSISESVEPSGNTSSSSSTLTNTTGPSSPSSSPQTAPNMPVPTAVTTIAQAPPTAGTTVVTAPVAGAPMPTPPVNGNNYELTQNGHMSLVTDSMVTNGVVLDQSAAAGQNGTFIVHGGMLQGPGVPVAGPGTGQPPTRTHPGPPPPGGPLQQPVAGNHRAHSPHRYSPNGPHSRGNSPHNGSSAAPNQQHVVHVHINPGETFSVRVGDQIQHIQGPATVRMVSNTGPPLPMPMQVPPGHMVQQIVDENGILTHVILSPQPQGMPPAPPMTGGPNSAPQQIYSPYPQYAYPTHTQYGPHHHPHHPPPPSHMHHVPPPHLRGTPTPPPQCNNHGPQAHHASTGGPPPHHNHLDDRTARQKHRLQDKLQRRKDSHYYHAHPPGSQSRSKNKSANGSVDPRRTDHSSSSSADGHELEEERRTIRALLSKMKLPKVSNVDARSALICLTPPECNPQEYDIHPTEFKYELLLSEKSCTGKYKLVYSGDATEITLQDLKPALEYHLKVCSILDDLKGDQTEPVSFRTQCCQPDPPLPPKLSTRTKTTLLLKWNAATDNGSKVTGYTLEYDQGGGDRQFVEIYSGLQRQYKVTKLTASTGYTFRLAAVNSHGKSKYCEALCFYTSGSAPSQPDPPMLGDQFVNALIISWIKRPNDDEFTLQMEDEVTGHGFLPVYNGSNLSHKIETLRRNTEYKFKLSANNDEGSSKWSDVVCYRTLPDRPSQPPKPQIKGKVHPTSFRVAWDPPRDNGGSEVSKYHLELNDSRGYVLVYEGLEREFSCDHLQPGHAYRLHVSSSSSGGQSEWSDCLTVQTQTVPPGICQSPKLHGKPKATLLHLRWNYPDYDGGAPVTEFEILMTLSDNTTREVYRGRDLDCTVAGLSPGRSYLFQVRASNKAGLGNWSESLEVVSGPGVPDPPKALTVNCKSPQLAVITWDEPVNNGATIADYRLEWQLRPDAEFTQLYHGPACNFEVRGLTPATLYTFRVQALNSAGAGPFSTLGSCVTPPSSPGAVSQLRASSTANSIQLSWREPQHNGSDIITYNIDLGEKHLICVSNVLEHVISDLLPETTYKVRVQAVNGIGVGAFSAPVKVTTRALPPNPPRLECVSFTHNSLKLKWGDGRNPDLIQYDLEMLRDNGSFQSVYHGPAHSYKVNKLTELTHYCFRIYASNEAGDGPCSEKFVFRTSKAPPPSVRPPKVSEVVLDSCQVDWQACKPMGTDSIIYCLQLQNVHSRDQEYKPVYKGADTSYRLEGLASKTEYQVRVCAVRVCADGTSDLTGAYSPGVSFVTQAPKLAPTPAQSTSTLAKLPEAKQLTDQHWAMIILLGFTIFAGIIAFLAQQIIAYTNNNSSDTAQ